MDFVLTGTLAPNAPHGVRALAERVLRYDPGEIKAVILGGGTGLSTIVGGNSQTPDWPDHPLEGMKREFARLSSIVCTTDDGGSTGRLRQFLPIIGVGDLRKLLLSSIRPEILQKKYNLDGQAAMDLIRAIHALFNCRFPQKGSIPGTPANPLLAIPGNLQKACPKNLCKSLRELGSYVSPGGAGPEIKPAGHSLGNLLLVSAIFMAAKRRTDRWPGSRDVQSGIDRIAELIGAPEGKIHAATAVPGQMKIAYANGVEVYGQHKSAQTRRNSAVASIAVEFAGKPTLSASVLNAIRKADLIVYAPGSLYTSIMPILQLNPIVKAIRENRRALKVLGANSWVQEGETDISLRNQGRGFLVSELIEAYDRNVPDGIEGLFDVVLSANLEHVPGNILRSYALEGKSPIHLDRERVEEMGVRPVEATLFSPDYERKGRAVHHDAGRFSLAIRTLLYAHRQLKANKGYALKHKPARPGRRIRTGDTDAHGTGKWQKGALLCDYLKAIRTELDGKTFNPPELKQFMLKLMWDNRDIRPSHLKHFAGATVISAKNWNRSTELDNILGYYDPVDRQLKLHEDLMRQPARLREDLLVAMGESLLGRYTEKRRWLELNGARCYEIVLRLPGERECFLSDSQLRAYLQMARMSPDAGDPRLYRIAVNSEEGFLPPGLLFGLLYSWYLCGSGLTMEYEMTLLRWPLKSLIPMHAKDRIRKKALVTFFRTVVFGHKK